MFDFLKNNQIAINSIFVFVSLLLSSINAIRSIKTKRRKFKELHAPIANAISVLAPLRDDDSHLKWETVFQEHVNEVLVSLIALGIECPEKPPILLKPDGINAMPRVSRLVYFFKDLLVPVIAGSLSRAQFIEIELNDARIQLREQKGYADV